MAVVEMIYRRPSTYITFRFGTYAAQIYQGLTVAEIRYAYKHLWNIPDHAEAWVGCRIVDDKYVPQAGECLDFARPSSPPPKRFFKTRR